MTFLVGCAFFILLFLLFNYASCGCWISVDKDEATFMVTFWSTNFDDLLCHGGLIDKVTVVTSFDCVRKIEESFQFKILDYNDRELTIDHYERLGTSGIYLVHLGDEVKNAEYLYTNSIIDKPPNNVLLSGWRREQYIIAYDNRIEGGFYKHRFGNRHDIFNSDKEILPDLYGKGYLQEKPTFTESDHHFPSVREVYCKDDENKNKFQKSCFKVRFDSNHGGMYSYWDEDVGTPIVYDQNFKGSLKKRKVLYGVVLKIDREENEEWDKYWNETFYPYRIFEHSTSTTGSYFHGETEAFFLGQRVVPFLSPWIEKRRRKILLEKVFRMTLQFVGIIGVFAFNSVVAYFLLRVLRKLGKLLWRDCEINMNITFKRL